MQYPAETRFRVWLWCLLMTILLVVAAVPEGSAAILRVRSGATNEPSNGSSWANAFPSLTNAVSAAVSGDEIWVAAGVYPGGLLVKSGLALYGGFAGTETTREERRPLVNSTVIDGRGAVTGVLFTSSAQPNTRVDGFLVQNCFGVVGGAFRSVLGSPTIANNIIFNNFATTFGAGIYLENSAAVISNNVITYNGTDALPAGGGLMASNSTPRIEGNTFSGNRARDGGGLHLAQSTGFVERNHFIANRAARDGGGLVYSVASPQTSHNRLIGNLSGSRGGGAAIFGGGAPQFFNNVLVRNAAATGTNGEPRGGGGLFIDAISQPRVVNNTLVSNTAPVGGILCSNQNVTLANNLVAFGSSGVGGSGSFAFFNNNCVFGNGGSNYVDTTELTGTGGNVSADPKFGGDTALAVVNILPDSVCRDAGGNQFLPPGNQVDIDGQPRIQGASVDIGADESDGVSTYFLPTVVRVTPTGNDDADGTTWAAAKKTIGAAIDAAARTGGEVWVQAGTYQGLVALTPLTSLYGGFAGGETNRAERNWTTNLTSLDGESRGSVVTMNRLSLYEAVDGFTITGGRNVSGAGIFTDSDVRISNNRFFSNVVLTVTPAAPTRGGGGIYVAAGAAQILNNQFVLNVAASGDRAQIAEGGAIKVNDGSPMIANNLFRHNFVTNSAALGEARGGAVSIVLRAAPQIINNTLLQNSALVSNGATASDQGGAVFVGNTNVAARLGNNLIAYNSSGIYAPGRVPDLRNNLVYANVRTNYERLPDFTGTNGNLSVSPRLTGPYGDPHLTAGSPCVDAGDDSLISPGWVDLDGRPRVSGVRVDIGADEFDGTVYTIADRVLYVRTDGNDTQDGSTWERAKKTVGAALLVAGLEGSEVWVKAGRYAERVRADVFTYLYGGFAGNETDRAERNWGTNVTVIDGSGGLGPAVVSTFGLDGYGTVSGFVIEGGAGRLGGGIFAHGSPRISDNLIRSNVVVAATGLPANGGGLFSQGGAPQVINNLFVGNSAPSTGAGNGRGGAIYLDPPPGAVPVVFNNTLLGNFATNGGSGLFVNAGAAQIANNIVAFNFSGLAAGTPAGVSNVLADFNCVFGNSTNDYVNLTPGTHSLSVDPQLVSATQGNYRLRADSACVDSADGSVAQSALDIFGEPRVSHSGLDIGADEFTGPLVADFNVTVTQPVAGATFVAPATVFLAADVAGGAVPPAYVEYSANGRVLALVTNAPFSGFSPNLLFDNYQVVAKAVTASGSIKASAPVGISVVLPPDNRPPGVAITSPTNGQKVIALGPTSVRFNLSFIKPNGRIISWTLSNGATVAAENPAVPVGQTSASATIPNLGFGEYTFTAVVTSNVGDKATNAVTFSVIERPPLEQPALLTPVMLTNGAVRLEMTLPSVGAVYVLESSTNFALWAPLATGTGTGGPTLVITNQSSTTNTLRYFRGRGSYP